MPKIFDTSYRAEDKAHARERHGLTWTKEEQAGLVDLFNQGCGLEDLCKILRRPAEGVLSKLSSLGCLSYDQATGMYFYSARSQDLLKSKHQPNNKTTMSINITDPIVIDNHTTINGVKIEGLSDTDLYGLIAKQESIIESLSKIKNQPRRLKAEISRRQAGIEALVTLLDGRPDNV